MHAKTPPPFRPVGPRTAAAVLLALAAALVLLTAPAPRAAASPQPPPPRVEQPPPPAQPPSSSEIQVILQGQARPRLRLAFPGMTGLAGLAGAARDAGRELDSTLRNDLRLSLIFEIQGPDAFGALELTGDRSHDFEQYRSLDNEMLLLTEVRQEGDELVFEGRLYELATGNAILGKRYRGGFAAARRIAHTFADEVVRYLADRPGVALTTLAFTSNRTGYKEIFLMDYDGFDQRQLTNHKSTSMSADWSPRGDGLAYVSFFNGPPGIYFAELPSGRKHPLIADGRFAISPSFSPDGRRLAFTRALGGNTEIFVADRDGRNQRRLTHSGAIDTNPAWSPKGGNIAFTSSRAGNPHIYLMDTEGTNLRRLTFEGDYNDGASWNADGDVIAYATRRGGVFQIALTNVVTLDTRVVTSGPGNKEQPSFSPDGRWIAYTSDVGGTKQIYVMDRNGGNVRRLTSEGSNESPAWSGYGR